MFRRGVKGVSIDAPVQGPALSNLEYVKQVVIYISSYCMYVCM